MNPCRFPARPGMLRHLMQTQTSRVPTAVAVGAVIVVIATVLHIDSLNERIDVLEQEREEQAITASLVQSAIDDLESAADDLSSAVSRFDYEDWRDVVPDVVSAASEIESGVESAKDRASGLR